MPDFFSRLVGRTFGLIPVVQPLTRSIFAPESRVRNDYMQDLSPGSESVSSEDNEGIDSFQNSVIIPQHKDLNQKKLLNSDSSKPRSQIENRDNQSYLTSTLKPSHNISSQGNGFVKSDSGFPEQIKPVSLHPMREPDDQHLYVLPAELSQDNKPIDKTGYNTFESVRGEDAGIDSIQNPGIIQQYNNLSLPQKELLSEDISKLRNHVKNRGNQSDLTFKLMSSHKISPQDDQDNKLTDEINYYTFKSDIFESVGPDSFYKKNFSNQRILKPIPKPTLNTEQFHPRGQDFQEYLEPFENNAANSPDKKLVKYELDSSLRSKILPGLKGSEPILQNNEPVSRDDFHASGGSYPDARSQPIIPSRQNLKQMSSPETSTLMEKMDKTLLGLPIAAVRPPSTAPTIKVTIGRIEVRAVKPPSEPQVQTPARQQPIFSLDDYLKQHNG